MQGTSFVIPDASPLILLGKVGLVGLLPKLFGAVLICPSVWKETVDAGRELASPDVADLEHFLGMPGFRRITLTRTEARDAVGFSRENIGRGEAEVLAVAGRRGNNAILDDRQARRLARFKAIPCIGTIGVLYEAFDCGLLERVAAVSAIEAFGRIAWLSPGLLARVLRRIEEKE